MQGGIPNFVHLHVHTHYSLLDGACQVGPLVKKTKALGMDSIAITDHGCLFGLIEFYTEAKKEGIKPILGMESYMAPGDRRERSTPGGNSGEAAYHLLLLAESIEGYRNLLKLGSIAYREGFYYKPRIDKEVLKEYSKGLICTSACLGGEIPSAFLKRDYKAAKKVAETYLEIFGPERFFIEVQKQGVKEQEVVNPELADLAKKLGVGLVATNDVHFLNKEDHDAHDVLCCISMGRLITDQNRLIYPKELYLKSPQEMIDAVGEWDGAISNTVEIAKRCNVELDFTKRYAPVYKVPKEKLVGFASRTGSQSEPYKDDEAYLRQLCEEGLAWRYGTREVSKDIRERLDYELKVICSKNFCSYFLIVWDFCNYARDNGIPVGARGSGVGTMVGYLLGLCNVDPIKYGLLFERFMDPNRSEMPDIDIDICQEGRGKIIDYVRQKYGHVAQIITFGTLAAKAACKDVGRVMGVPLAEIDKLTKLIPNAVGMTLKKALEQSPDLAALYQNNPAIQKVIDVAKRLEGTCRNAGCHAAGVVIADQPLENFVPLYKAGDDILTQYEGPIVEKCGLLKMDFLGLRTLTTLTRAVELVKKTKGIEIDVEKIDFTDKNVLAMFCRGETRGIFQFESGGMQDLLMKMRPDRIEDLIAANALFRPGPMELIPLYCNRKHGREQVPKVHSIMDKILEETYGIMVYQEQVMQIFNQLGGIELSAAYKLIKAISKKTVDVIAKYQPEFMKGTMAKGVSKEKAQEIFDHILKFGGYGFNKSHSTRYAIIAFQTAFMKVYHSVEYMSALLTFEMGDTDKVVEYIEECRRMAVGVLPPDVNLSDMDFTPIYEEKQEGKRKAKKSEGVIRFGMMAVRGVGEKAVEAIIAERKARGAFHSLYEFCERVDLRQVTRATIEALVKCGAFSSMGAKRAQLLHVLERAVEMGQQSQNDKRAGQMNMFGAAAASTVTSSAGGVLPEMQEIASAELLKFERELLGFYITSNPLTEHKLLLDSYTTHTTKDATSCSDGTEVTIGGRISSVEFKITKSGESAGQKWAKIRLEDLDGNLEGLIWADGLAEITSRYPDVVKAERIVFIKGKVDRRRETPSVRISEVIPIEESIAKLTTGLEIKLDEKRQREDVVEQLVPVIKAHSGQKPVRASVTTTDGQVVTLQMGDDHRIRPTKAAVEELERVLGSGGVQIYGAGSKRAQRVAQQQLFNVDEKEADVSLPAVEVGLDGTIE